MSDIPGFVQRLLSKPPGEPNSVQFEVDTDDGPQALFEVMLMIMTEIMKSWYSPPIHLASISHEDVGRLVAYFASFGIKFDLDVRDEPRVYRINNRSYETKSQLEDMIFQMTSEGKLYTVRFSI